MDTLTTLLVMLRTLLLVGGGSGGRQMRSAGRWFETNSMHRGLNGWDGDWEGERCGFMGWRVESCIGRRCDWMMRGRVVDMANWQLGLVQAIVDNSYGARLILV